MLQPAQLYTDKLKQLFMSIAYDDRFKYLHGCSHVDEYKPSDSTWHCHEFVSVDKDKNIIGYIKYNVWRDTYTVGGLQVVNFTLKPNLVFAKDLHEALTDIFEKYKFHKLSFRCVVGNPIEKSYDKIINKYNGRIVGVHEKHSRLLDGEYYDMKDYEILKVSYLLSDCHMHRHLKGLKNGKSESK